jgi:hypothetical protein
VACLRQVRGGGVVGGVKVPTVELVCYIGTLKPICESMVSNETLRRDSCHVEMVFKMMEHVES